MACSMPPALIRAARTARSGESAPRRASSAARSRCRRSSCSRSLSSWLGPSVAQTARVSMRRSPLRRARTSRRLAGRARARTPTNSRRGIWSCTSGALESSYRDRAPSAATTARNLESARQRSRICAPTPRIVVGAEVLRSRLRSNGMVEHAAQCAAIHDSGMDTEADDPPSVLVHDHQHPMASQDRGLAPKHVDAPQAVFRMPQERQP